MKAPTLTDLAKLGLESYRKMTQAQIDDVSKLIAKQQQAVAVQTETKAVLTQEEAEAMVDLVLFGF